MKMKLLTLSIGIFGSINCWAMGDQPSSSSSSVPFFERTKREKLDTAYIRSLNKQYRDDRNRRRQQGRLFEFEEKPTTYSYLPIIPMYNSEDTQKEIYQYFAPKNHDEILSRFLTMEEMPTPSSPLPLEGIASIILDKNVETDSDEETVELFFIS